MKVYARHRCTAKHRTTKTFMRCAIPNAVWVDGKGDLALIAWCGSGPSVALYEDLDEAEKRKRILDDAGCGGGCRGRC